MVHFYHMDPERLLKLPMRLFWSAIRHVDRLRAAQELRLLNVMTVAAVTAQGEKESHKDLRASLMEQLGTVMRIKEKRSTKNELMAFMQETVK